jgi:hypothetical protein
MNDFSEIAYGVNCFKGALGSGLGGRYTEALSAIDKTLPEAVLKRFLEWETAIHADTYLTCFSEHDDEEDSLGRLSMWRAYGGSTAVALVINGGVMFRPSTVLGAYSSPVLYANQSTFDIFFGSWLEGLESNSGFLSSRGPEAVGDALFEAMRYFVLSTKHPGFKEEREWRVIASPVLHPSAMTKVEVATIAGVPQYVVKLPLKNAPESGLTGLEPAELINRVIIGPCEHPQLVAHVFFDLLRDLGFSRPGDHLAVSDIPLRRSG